MTENELEFIQITEESIRTKNTELIKLHMNLFSEFCFNNEPYNIETAKVTDAFIETIVDILNKEGLWQLEGSYSFIMFFYNDWARFTTNQKKRLILVFENIFPNIIDTTAQQVLIEIISENEANENSFRILNKLNSTQNNERYRYLIAYGYQRLIENTKNSSMKIDVFRLLNEMVEDTLENVRTEAKCAINALYSRKDLKSMIDFLLLEKKENYANMPPLK